MDQTSWTNLLLIRFESRSFPNSRNWIMYNNVNYHAYCRNGIAEAYLVFYKECMSEINFSFYRFGSWLQMALLWYQQLEMMVLYMGKATPFVSQNRIIIINYVLWSFAYWILSFRNVRCVTLSITVVVYTCSYDPVMRMSIVHCLLILETPFFSIQSYCFVIFMT